MALHFHKLTVKYIRKETADCVSIAFDIPVALANDFIFKQGQNITIKKIIDGEEIRRSYSICSSPLENELRIAVKKVVNGAFSVFANEKLFAGDVLEVLPPSGSFFTEVNSLNKKNYLFFAAGSGITPVISLIKTILQTEPESTATLVFGNKNVSSIIFKEEIESLKDKYLKRFITHHILSIERTDAEINFGRIDADKCLQLSRFINFKDADEFFICGPEQMIFCVNDFLINNKIQKSKIHFELFTTPKRRVNNVLFEKRTENKGSDVTVKVDGHSFSFTLDYNGSNILDAALAQGADLPFSCKGGVCTTCKARLIKGKVEMEVNYGLEPDEVENGFILTCQSHPQSQTVVVDFDAK